MTFLFTINLQFNTAINKGIHDFNLFFWKIRIFLSSIEKYKQNRKLRSVDSSEVIVDFIIYIHHKFWIEKDRRTMCTIEMNLSGWKLWADLWWNCDIWRINKCPSKSSRVMKLSCVGSYQRVEDSEIFTLFLVCFSTDESWRFKFIQKDRIF